MVRQPRRAFLKSLSTAAGAGLLASSAWARPLHANDDLRVAVVGVNGFGKIHIKAYQNIQGVRLVALCDVDQAVLNRVTKKLDKHEQPVRTYTDIRELLDAQDIDAISVVTPNHWHALATVWACQAGKDVHVEKPISHNIFESRKMVEAAHKYKRIVQSGMEARSSPSVHLAVKYLQEGNLGEIIVARAFVYKRRTSMGLVTKPQSVPKSIDYDLWCGPAPLAPLMRKNFHYDWHWQWPYGCGAIGNNGAHMLDKLRMALGNPHEMPTRVMSYGGRFGEKDNGETPDTNVALFELNSVPVIFEARALGHVKGDPASDAFRAVGKNGLVMEYGEVNPRPKTGVMIQCEGGYLDLTPFGDYAAYDNEGKEIARFKEKESPYDHDINFVKAVRSRKPSDLNGEILEGHYSAALSHLGNISYRVGHEAPVEEVRASFEEDYDALETFARFQKHLEANEIDLDKAPPILGPWLTMDSTTERFVGKFSEQANNYVSREYRKPFVVPEQV